MEMEKFKFYESSVAAKAGKSVALRLPKLGNYEGYKAWVPLSLIEGRYAAKTLTLNYHEDMEFNIQKSEKGPDGKYIVVDTQKITGAELANEFKGADQSIREYAEKMRDQRELEKQLKQEAAVQDEFKEEKIMSIDQTEEMSSETDIEEALPTIEEQQTM